MMVSRRAFSAGRGPVSFLGALALGLMLGGCVPDAALVEDVDSRRIAGAKVLLMEPDVVLSEMTAGGLEEPNVAWTEQGLANVRHSIDQIVQARAASIIPYRAPDSGSDIARRSHRHQQLTKLHGVVGTSILVHHYNPVFKLPTKPGPHIDWTLGSGARLLRDDFGADYALFVFLHDSYASAGRVATIVLMAALGIGVSGGVQRGFASLVDLRTGDIVWFNRLVRGTGDLRTAASARDAVVLLLDSAPL